MVARPIQRASGNEHSRHAPEGDERSDRRLVVQHQHQRDEQHPARRCERRQAVQRLPEVEAPDASPGLAVEAETPQRREPVRRQEDEEQDVDSRVPLERSAEAFEEGDIVEASWPATRPAARRAPARRCRQRRSPTTRSLVGRRVRPRRRLRRSVCSRRVAPLLLRACRLSCLLYRQHLREAQGEDSKPRRESRRPAAPCRSPLTSPRPARWLFCARRPTRIDSAAPKTYPARGATERAGRSAPAGAARGRLSLQDDVDGFDSRRTATLGGDERRVEPHRALGHLELLRQLRREPAAG